MKYSTKLSDALHILVFLGLGAGRRPTSARIAESVKTTPAYIRQLMAALKATGIITSMRGQANAGLARSPGEITVLDVYRAVEGRKPTRPSHRYSRSSRPKVPTAAMIWLSVREEISMPTAISTAPSRKKARMAP